MDQLIYGLRAGRAEHTPEVEAVLVTLHGHDRVTLTLDDGETLDLDAQELRAALGPAVPVRAVQGRAA